MLNTGKSGTGVVVSYALYGRSLNKVEIKLFFNIQNKIKLCFVTITPANIPRTPSTETVGIPH